MNITVPLAISTMTTNVTASSLTEWSSGTSYAEKAQVKYTTGQAIPHHEFESLQNSNSNHVPVIGGSSYWLDLGATNQHRMFDGLNNSRTVATAVDGSIQISITTSGRVQSIALIGLRNAATVTVEQVVSGVSQWTKTVDLVTSYDAVGWWSWLFGTRTYARSAVIPVTGIHATQTLNVTIESGSSAAECGQLLIGRVYELGDTEWGAQPGLRDYSTFEDDTFGNTLFVPRQNKRTGDFTFWVPHTDFDRVYAILEDLIGSLALFDGNNSGSDYDSLRVYGKIDSVTTGLTYSMTPIDVRILGMN